MAYLIEMIMIDVSNRDLPGDFGGARKLTVNRSAPNLALQAPSPPGNAGNKVTPFIDLPAWTCRHRLCPRRRSPARIERITGTDKQPARIARITI